MTARHYPYGNGPLGFEVGQRTLPFLEAWPVRASPSLYGRDQRVLTEERVKRLFATHSLGFRAPPVWSGASSRRIPLTGGALAYPNNSPLLAFRDALYGMPGMKLVLGMRYACDSSFGSMTGPGIPNPRTAWTLPFALPPGAVLADGRAIRPADSFWDFMTAFDPVALADETGGTVFRNVTALTAVPRTAEGGPGLRAVLPTGQPGEPVAVVWNDSPSLDQDSYIPAVETVWPVAAGFDLAGEFLTPSGLSSAWTPDSAGYPTPFRTALTGADEWGSETIPFGAPVMVGDGNDVFLVPGVPEDSVTLYQNGSVCGTVHKIFLQNAWDTAGEIMRLQRLEEENDFSYAGRQQRLWLYALLSGTRAWPGGSRFKLERGFSALLGRVAILPSWNGYESANLPAKVTHLDVLGLPAEIDGLQLLLTQDDLIEVSGGNLFRCRHDLFGYGTVTVYQNDTLLRRGSDWLLSQADPSLLYLRVPVLAEDTFYVFASGRRPARTVLTEGTGQAELPESLGAQYLPAPGRIFVESVLTFDGFPRISGETPFTSDSLVPEPLRAPAATGWEGPLAASYGPVLRGAGELLRRTLLFPGGVLPTQQGLSLAPIPSSPSWSDTAKDGNAFCPPPLDLETGSVNAFSDGCFQTVSPYS